MHASHANLSRGRYKGSFQRGNPWPWPGEKLLPARQGAPSWTTILLVLPGVIPHFQQYCWYWGRVQPRAAWVNIAHEGAPSCAMLRHPGMIRSVVRHGVPRPGHPVRPHHRRCRARNLQRRIQNHNHNISRRPVSLQNIAVHRPPP